MPRGQRVLHADQRRSIEHAWNSYNSGAWREMEWNLDKKTNWYKFMLGVKFLLNFYDRETHASKSSKEGREGGAGQQAAPSSPEPAQEE